MERLGIIDWGIGGISIHKLIKEKLADIPIVYFSDTGFTPYGKLTRPNLVSRLDAVIDFLKSQGITHLIIGCNAASTAILYLKHHDIAIEGVIDTAIAETVKLKPHSLGLMGGRRTVLSGIYRKGFARYGIRVRQRIAQPLSGLIESGDISSPTLRNVCKHIQAPLRNCSHILLACTHYPAILPVLEDLAGHETVFVDPVPALVDVVRRWGLAAGGGDSYFTTGSPEKMRMAAARAFNWDIDTPAKITV